MENNARFSEVEKIFQDVFQNPNLKISRQDNASSVDNWDSLNNIRLVLGVEKRFKVKFALGELQDLKNVGDLVDLVEKKEQVR